MQVDLHPEAAEEAAAAVEWYRERSEAAAAAYTAELERAIELIAAEPDQWPPYLQGTRRFILRRFPFSIVYRKSPVAVEVEVIAVAHARRRPGYWRGR